MRAAVVEDAFRRCLWLPDTVIGLRQYNGYCKLRLEINGCRLSVLAHECSHAEVAFELFLRSNLGRNRSLSA